MATPNLCEDVEKITLIYSFLEDGWVVSYKAKHTLTIWSRHCPPWYLPKYVENFFPPKSWSSFIHNHQKLSTIRCPSVGEWISRLWDILTIEYYLAIKRNEWSIHEKINKQGVNIQPWCTPFPIWNQSVVPCPVLTVASWPAYRFLRRQVR